MNYFLLGWWCTRFGRCSWCCPCCGTGRGMEWYAGYTRCWMVRISLFCPLWRYNPSLEIYKSLSVFELALTSSCKFCSLNDAYLSKHESAILGWPLWLTTSSLVRQTWAWWSSASRLLSVVVGHQCTKAAGGRLWYVLYMLDYTSEGWYRHHTVAVYYTTVTLLFNFALHFPRSG